ncbi:MAG TPA: hypothetical protein VN911_08935 [Candidatus Acidoferrum sp.]|nr:hypothetical protein [Candidatus Acidoferrum sp.]
MGAIQIECERSQPGVQRRVDGLPKKVSSCVHIAGEFWLFVNESLGKSLCETSSVKYFTGGDVLVGAAMRQNEVHRKPSHKLVTITNHLPIISADPAVLGRVQVVPFRASFLGREDPTVEPEMRTETAGILYRWMIAAREFLEIGLKPPQCVLDASQELFAEGDVVDPLYPRASQLFPVRIYHERTAAVGI